MNQSSALKNIKYTSIHCHPVHDARDTFTDYSRYISMLDNVGLDKVVMYGNISYGVTDEMIVNFVRKFPRRIIGVPEIIPWEKDVKDKIKSFALEHGMSGIKLHPSLGFKPDDKKLMYPIYELCLKLNLAIACHSAIAGPVREKTFNDCCQPIFFDRVSDDFPELRIVISHCGWPLIEQTHLLSWRSNIALDITRISPFYYKNYWKETIGLLLWRFGPQRILFGNLGILGKNKNGYDFKTTENKMKIELKDTLKLLTGLKKNVETELTALDTGDYENIMGGNALRLFAK